MPLNFLSVAKSKNVLGLLPNMANRHGLITGATGTGKTVTLQVLAEQFSQMGIPVFMADVKGDLSGLSQTGVKTPKLEERILKYQLPEPHFRPFPVMFWDVFGEQGHPVRTTVSEMGPVLFSRLLNLNDVQSGVLNIIFKVADDQGLLLLDLKDLQALVKYVGDNSSTLTTTYGNVSTASIGAIQRGLLTLDEQGGNKFFGEPALSLDDFIQTSSDGKGIVNILASDKLLLSPRVYSTLLLWLLSELFEQLPEAGDLEKPKLVFFFDEAHLLFSDAPKALLEKIEQVVRLVRSKGVGIYFITQNPLDVPETILGQLGNRVQHALRAFTPLDQKAVKTAAQTFRASPGLDVEKAITELATGEALVSFLDEKGAPTPVERAWIFPPQSQIGAITSDQRIKIIQSSIIYGHYEKQVDRESAFEVLKKKVEETTAQAQVAVPSAPAQRSFGGGRSSDSILEAMAKSAARAAASQVGRQIIRGVLGSIFGGGARRR
ncbi:MAG: helicase HerA-like domain-containing protein [Elusimicrobiota bacterium]